MKLPKCIALLAALGVCHAQTSSQLIGFDPDGRLIYIPDAQGNTVPDFSRVGYMDGERAIPDVPVVLAISPVPGDNLAHVQAAIAHVSALPKRPDGFRGALLLTAGDYPVGNSLDVTASGVVIRGEGSGTGGTRLIATRPSQHDFIRFIGGGLIKDEASRKAISNSYLPTGSRQVTMPNAHGFAMGDRVILTRNPNAAWITLIGMDSFWSAGDFIMDYRRRVTAVNGNTVTLDAPVVDPIDSNYGTGFLLKYTWSARLEKCGIENLSLVSEYASPIDELHGWEAIVIDNAENCWVRNLEVRHFGNSAVTVNRNSSNISILNTASIDPIALTEGGRKSPFNLGGHRTLVKNCSGDKSRHDYLTGAKTPGPNVFTQSVSTNQILENGPHQRWATGTLFDQITSSYQLNVYDRNYQASGQGWAGAQTMIWNCVSDKTRIQSPPGHVNWAIGNIAEVVDLGDAYIASTGTHVLPLSLYEKQLADRLAASPNPYQDADLGGVNPEGDSLLSDGTLFIRGGGSDIWGSGDQCHFTYQSIGSQNFEIIARVTSLEAVNSWTKCGLMIRESLDAGSKNAALVLTPGNGVLFQRRAATDASTTEQRTTGLSAPVYLRLLRNANSLSGWHSSNGTDWIQIGTTTTIAMSGAVQAGFCIASRVSGTPAKATLDHLYIGSPSGDYSLAASPASHTVTAGDSAGFTVTIANTDPSTGTVSLGATDLPPGASAGFSPPLVVGAGSSSLSITTTAATPAAVYPVTITGNNASATHSAVVNLKVKPYHDADIGGATPAGNSEAENGGISLTGGGADIWESSDQFHFAWLPITRTHCEVVARVLTLQGPSGWSKCGVMLRKTLEPDSPYAAAMVTPANGVRAQFRKEPASLASDAKATGQAAPVYLRVLRNGNSFSCWYGANGTDWNQLGTAQTIAMGETALAGFCISSHVTGSLATATLDNLHIGRPQGDFSVHPAPDSETTVSGDTASFSITLADSDAHTGAVFLSASGLPAGAAAAFDPAVIEGTGTSVMTVTTSRDTPAVLHALTIHGSSATLSHEATVTLIVKTHYDADIGSVIPPGEGNLAGGVLTLVAGGNDIWGTADQFYFTYLPMTGSQCKVEARVSSLTGPSGWTKCGVMIRETLEPGSRHAATLVTPANGVRFQHRLAPNGSTADSKFSGKTAPVYLRAVRSGNRFSGWFSSDGTNWTRIGSPQTITMGDTIYAGFVLTSQVPGTAASAELDHIGITPLAKPSIANPERVAGGFRMRIHGDVGPEYVIQHSDDLSDWKTLTTISSGSMPTDWTDTDTGGAARRFYRILLGGS